MILTIQKKLNRICSGILSVWYAKIKFQKHILNYLLHKLGPTQSKCRIQNYYDISLNEFPAYFGKCQNLIFDISQNLQKIHSKIYHNLKANIWLALNTKVGVLTSNFPKYIVAHHKFQYNFTSNRIISQYELLVLSVNLAECFFWLYLAIITSFLRDLLQLFYKFSSHDQFA